MKESELYLAFIRRNFLFLVIPIIISLVISIYFYSVVPSRVKILQTFKMQYTLGNIDTVLALADQAVAELRAQRFDKVYPDAEVTIFKSAPLDVSFEAVSLNRDTSYALLLKEIEYLRQNFLVQELTSPEIIFVEPNVFKYLISGLMIGGFVGLVISLIREYFRNY